MNIRYIATIITFMTMSNLLPMYTQWKNKASHFLSTFLRHRTFSTSPGVSTKTPHLIRTAQEYNRDLLQKKIHDLSRQNTDLESKNTDLESKIKNLDASPDATEEVIDKMIDYVSEKNYVTNKKLENELKLDYQKIKLKALQDKLTLDQYIDLTRAYLKKVKADTDQLHNKAREFKRLAELADAEGDDEKWQDMFLKYMGYIRVGKVHASHVKDTQKSLDKLIQEKYSNFDMLD